MKKWIVFLFTIFLMGCSEPVSNVYESTSQKESDQQRVQMDVKVHVYSLEQNNEGYIIKWDDRDKWVITNASVVYQHPKALIETSNIFDNNLRVSVFGVVSPFSQRDTA